MSIGAHYGKADLDLYTLEGPSQNTKSSVEAWKNGECPNKGQEELEQSRAVWQISLEKKTPFGKAWAPGWRARLSRGSCVMSSMSLLLIDPWEAHRLPVALGEHPRVPRLLLTPRQEKTVKLGLCCFQRLLRPALLIRQPALQEPAELAEANVAGLCLVFLIQ